MQKQSLADVLQIRCSYKLFKVHRKTPVLESLFNKVAGLQACNFIKKRLQRKCFPVKFAKFLRTNLFTEHLRWLLLKLKWHHHFITLSLLGFLFLGGKKETRGMKWGHGWKRHEKKKLGLHFLLVEILHKSLGTKGMSRRFSSYKF